MTTRILTEAAASISELKANPMKVAMSDVNDAIVTVITVGKRDKGKLYKVE